MFMWILLQLAVNKLLSEIVENRTELTSVCSVSDETKQFPKIIIFYKDVKTEQN